jgi:hypothetical protein
MQLAGSSTWLEGIRRVVLSTDERHWSNSLGMWLALNALDAVTTWLCLSAGMCEANPLLGLISRAGGDSTMLVGKMLLAVLVGLVVWRVGTCSVRGLLNLGMSIVLIINCFFAWKVFWLLNASAW